MDRKYLLEFVRVTEAAAAACARGIGRGNKTEADGYAVAGMRRAFDEVGVRGRVVIGEGEMDEAPMLYIGEVVGPDNPSLPVFDIAVDPLEGTSLCAKNQPGAIAVLAAAPEGTLLAAPDMYMDKIACGPAGRGVVDLDKTPRDNLLALAEAMRRKPEEMNVVVLERPRHEALVRELRAVGAHVTLISDGDVAPAVAAGMFDTGIDLMMGRGGAPEGVLSAAALKALGGEFQARLWCEDDAQRDRARQMAGRNPADKLMLDDVVRDECFFAATGVTTGPFLEGVRRQGGRVHLHSLALYSGGHEVRYFETVADASAYEVEPEQRRE